MVNQKYKVDIVDADYYRKTISCQNACPVHTDARGYVNAIAEGDYRAGYIMARQPNPFASTCGRVCNAPCEAACRRGNIDAPVAIRALKRFVCERYGVESKEHPAISRTPGERLMVRAPGNFNTVESLANLLVTSERKPRDGRRARIAVIGAGPAGLTAAHDLAAMGHQVTIFEASPVAGGMLRLGIPEFRLPRKLIEQEIADILELGVQLKLNSRIGDAFKLKTLRQEGYDAFFIAVGLGRGRELNIEGVELDGVMRAIEFLLNVNMGYRLDLGQKVLVVGGGAVAMDVARTAARAGETEPVEVDGELAAALDVAREAIRAGTPEVHVLCLERREGMPVAPEEVEDALAEGVILHTALGPKRILGEKGRVTGLETLAVASVFDSQGRFNPSFTPATESVIEGDTVILAVGQRSDLSFISEEDGIKTDARGTIVVDPDTLATSAPGIFAGGDVVFGPRIIIEAVRDGHTAARHMNQYLRGKRAKVVTRGWMETVPAQKLPRHDLDAPYQRLPTLSLDRRVGMAEVELDYPGEVAEKQAWRCVRCYIQTVFNGDLCILCGGCVDVCPWSCLKMVRLDHIAGDQRVKDVIQARYGISFDELQNGSGALNVGTAMIKDETRCTRCGLCAERCPTGAITMEDFQFSEELVDEDTPEDAGVK
ncbi:MAG: FAD-dependent oxidoreductase [Chloroflexota bacterium]|nr:FAD-dependent oxidoreductase [Chloroflexota bacterium]